MKEKEKGRKEGNCWLKKNGRENKGEGEKILSVKEGVKSRVCWLWEEGKKVKRVYWIKKKEGREGRKGEG